MSSEGLPALLSGSVQALVLAASAPDPDSAAAGLPGDAAAQPGGRSERRVALTQQDFARVR